jgi:hypothetical protein
LGTRPKWQGVFKEAEQTLGLTQMILAYLE